MVITGVVIVVVAVVVIAVVVVAVVVITVVIIVVVDSSLLLPWWWLLAAYVTWSGVGQLPAATMVGRSRSWGLHRRCAPHHRRHRHGCRHGWQRTLLGAALTD